MSFLAPDRLWLLLAVVALAVVYVAMQLHRRRYEVRFTNLELLSSVAPRRPGWRRHVAAVAFLAAIGSLVVAFAQPARDEEVPTERATVVIALDTSISMEAEDVDPNRFEAAKDAAKVFVDEVPDGINVGLVNFDGTAVTRVAPTDEHTQVTESIDRLELDESTAIGDAILASLAAIETVPPDDEGTRPPASIVLLSDGDQTAGTPSDIAVDQAREAGVPVSTIAFGTESGTIELPDAPTGSTLVPVNPETLSNIASATGGTFFTAATGAELRSVYEDIGSSVGYETEQREITIWFVGLALALLLVTAALSLLFFARLP